MIESQEAPFIYRLKRTSYLHTRRIAWLLIAGSFVCAVACILLSLRLFPTYSHTFTLYLKWQDALLATLVFTALLALGSCVLVLRFLYALQAGYSRWMLQLQGNTFTGRDLSPKNLSSIYWLVSTVFGCFLAALVGLVPLILIGWTLRLPHPLLVVLGTSLASILSLAGLIVTAIALAFVLIGFAGSISFCRKMGAPQTYNLTQQASISINGFVLSILYPDQQESLFDLNLLEPADARHLLHLLHERWFAAQSDWNPTLGQEIEEALCQAERAALTV
ncbi:MAG TPA: hypothetical protein VFA09_09740 [Ktedonobacteraceae bacterium]|nr:hypothetical protein [Ktedonobacteraceae bacterium]